MIHKRSRSFDLLSKYDYCLPGWKGFLILAGLFIVGLCLASFTAVLLTTVLGMDFFSDYGTLIIYPLQFIPMMIWCSANSGAAGSFAQEPEHPLDRQAVSGLPKTAVIALTAAAATLAVSFIADPIGLLLPPMPEKMIQTMKMLVEGPLWAAVLSTVIFAPFFEEWLCRGMILRPLLTRMHPAAAIMISALVFALIHGNVWQGIPAFILGCLFGLAYYRTGSLKLTMLMHATNNLFSVIVSRSGSLDLTECMYDMFADKTLFAFVYILCTAMTAAFISLLFSRRFCD